MDFWKTLKVLLRRWRVAVPVFAVSLGLAAGVYLSVDTEYESSGTIVLTSPTDGARVAADQQGPADRVNPLLAFDASLNTSATIIIQKLQDPVVQEQLTGASKQIGYEIGNGQLTGPFIVVVALARTPDDAKNTVGKVLDRARTELKQSQEALKAPASTFITPVDIISPTNAEPKTGGKVRFAAVALALGFIASLSSAYAMESFTQSRKKKRSRERAQQQWQHQGSLEQNGSSGETVRTHPVTQKPG
ncbi:hypothetical protein KIPE111705_09455 [Kibdelosporangium persicum]|uniref:Capsular polysaccharide biosynthesis protein n=1 Tax=Kibdelosporangium persicum TaxID=2698649 RepID=A0ABX2FCQ8_9PSEU|nr:hypothetical protein [Kibdelosporangium persicum]NRN68671.1 Capsular polysaccharide biosynthesis protein [Kibdelosporangium persicum]